MYLAAKITKEMDVQLVELILSSVKDKHNTVWEGRTHTILRSADISMCMAFTGWK